MQDEDGHIACDDLNFVIQYTPGVDGRMEEHVSFEWEGLSSG